MSAVYEVPIAGSRPQTITVTFPNGVPYRMRFDYLFQGQPPVWTMDIADGEGTPILCGMPLVCGVNLLAQFAYLGLAAILWCTVDGDSFGELIPGPFNLGPGLTSHLWLAG